MKKAITAEEFFHKALFAAVLASFVAGVWWLATGDLPGGSELVVSTYLTGEAGGWLMRMRRKREVAELKALHELPAVSNDH